MTAKRDKCFVFKEGSNIILDNFISHITLASSAEEQLGGGKISTNNPDRKTMYIGLFLGVKLTDDVTQ